MSAAYIDGKWACYSLVDGRRRHLLGCRHERPRQAIAHTSGSYVSPLRREAHADPVIPLAGSGQSGFSPEPRKQLRATGQARG